MSEQLTAQEAKRRVLKEHPRVYAEGNSLTGTPTWFEIVERQHNWSAYYGEGATVDLAWLSAYTNLEKRK